MEQHEIHKTTRPTGFFSRLRPDSIPTTEDRSFAATAQGVKKYGSHVAHNTPDMERRRVCVCVSESKRKGGGSVCVCVFQRQAFLPSHHSLFSFFFPQHVPPHATAARWGEPLSLESELPRVEIICVGSVAVDPHTGARVGKGEGFMEIEYGITRLLGAVDDRVPVVTTVRDEQLVPGLVPPGASVLPHDVRLGRDGTSERGLLMGGMCGGAVCHGICSPPSCIEALSLSLCVESMRHAPTADPLPADLLHFVRYTGARRHHRHTDTSHLHPHQIAQAHRVSSPSSACPSPPQDYTHTL